MVVGRDSRQRAKPDRSGEAMCNGSQIQHDRNVALCKTERVGMPYAANRLRVLGSRGVWTLPGQSGSPGDSAQCMDLCIAPGYIVVQVRTGLHYRTYGYPVGSGANTSGSAVALLDSF